MFSFQFKSIQHNCIQFNSITIINVSSAPNQHIRRSSEGSCDTEDWNNGCWKCSFAITRINYISAYVKTENSYFEL